MNIGIVTTWFPSGGGYVAKAYREILSKEHRVFIYARGGKKMKGDPNWDDADVTWAPYHYNGIKTKHLIHWATRNRIDILFFNEQRYWKPVIEAKKANFCVGAYIDYYKQSTIKAFELYDFLICNTKRHYSVFSWHPNAYYIPWGTDVEKFKPNLLKEKRITTFLISAGNEGEYGEDRKGVSLAIEAFQKVKGDCRLLIYSQLALERCLPNWHEQITQDPRISFIHGTFDPFPFSEGDVYVYPSRLDGIGLSLPEALSCGLPAITTNSPPMNEFVMDGVNGTLIDVEKYLGREDGYYWAESICSIELLSKAMKLYVDFNNLANEQGERSRAYVIENLDWERNAFKLNKIFSEIIDQRVDLRPELSKLLIKLDRRDSPTFRFKIIVIVYYYIKYLLKRVFPYFF